MMKLSPAEMMDALKRLQNTSDDKVGLLGDASATGIGTAAGIAAANSVAGAFGATTLCGSSFLASALGGVFVTATPVGWIIGTAVAGGSLAYGATKLIRSGERADYQKKLDIDRLRELVKKALLGGNPPRQVFSGDALREITKAGKALIALEQCLNFGCFTEQKFVQCRQYLEDGKMEPDFVLEFTAELLTESIPK